jgi:glycosyltransferase involved in cell wall biosynthesis
MAAPSVSVVIPAHNAAGFLEGTIASLQAQTFPDWEALIIDDGSTDGTRSLVLDLLVGDPRLRLISVVNQGVSAARNLGVAESQAPLIAFLDADDRWRPTKLSRHLEHLASDPGLGVSFDRVEFLSCTGSPTGQFSRSRLNHLATEHFLYENPTTTTSTWVVRRAVFEQVGGFLPGLSYSEDLEWLLRARCRGWRIEGLPEVLTGYRTSPAGLSADLSRMDAGWSRLVEQARHYAPELVARHFRRARAVHQRYLARRSLRLHEDAAAQGVHFMRQALGSDPSLLWRQPLRTWLTVFAVLMRRWRVRLKTTWLGRPKTS